ncbi:MAG: flavin reductase [Breoghania sp.]|nr:flavin reductase [Breoghania sp.]
MSRLSATVNLITSDGPEGRHGMTASAVSSVTDDPPTLLVCVNQQNRSHDRFNANGKLCVNVLGDRHQEIAGLFASRGSDERFSKGEWITLQTGAPVLQDAIVAFDCRISWSARPSAPTPSSTRRSRRHVSAMSPPKRSSGSIAVFIRSLPQSSRTKPDAAASRDRIHTWPHTSTFQDKEHENHRIGRWQRIVCRCGRFHRSWP